MKKPVYLTFPWAFITPGGGEIQIKKYCEYLSDSKRQLSMIFGISISPNFILFISFHAWGLSHTVRFFRIRVTK